jgi:hypothetical protein
VPAAGPGAAQESSAPPGDTVDRVMQVGLFTYADVDGGRFSATPSRALPRRSRTPCRRSRAEVHVKFENLQFTGSMSAVLNRLLLLA